MSNTVQGWDELRRKLRQLSGAVSGKVVLAAVEVGALVIENAAKSDLHEGYGVVTGNLRRSLHHEPSLNFPPERPEDRGGTPPPGNTDTSAVVDIGTDVVYARRVHDGFVGKDKLKRNYNQAGHPYLLGPYEAVKNEAMSETSAALKQLVERASR